MDQTIQPVVKEVAKKYATKGTTDYTPEHWRRNLMDVKRDSVQMFDDSFKFRVDSRRRRTVATFENSRDDDETKRLLYMRMQDMDGWLNVLENTLDRIKNEMVSLAQTKESLQLSQKHNQFMRDITKECLDLRDLHKGEELIRDSADQGLNEELQELNGNLDKMKGLWDDEEKKSRDLDNTRILVMQNIDDIIRAINVDDHCHELDIRAPGLALKPQIRDQNIKNIHSEDWIGRCNRNKDRANHDIGTSGALRESIRKVINTATTDNTIMLDKNNFFLHRRLVSIEKAINDMEWQKLLLTEESDVLKHDVKELELAVETNLKNLEVAHTRLDTRTYRPPREKINDPPQEIINDALRRLEIQKEKLERDLKHGREMLGSILNQIDLLDSSMREKREAAQLDRMCMDRLRVGAKAMQTMLDTDTKLNRIERIPALVPDNERKPPLKSGTCARPWHRDT